MQRSTNSYKEERTDFIIGITVVAIALLLLGWLTWSAIKGISDNTETIADGEIVKRGESVRGMEQTYTFLPNAEILQGTPVVWTVDGEIVKQCDYEGEEITLNFTYTQSGKHEIVASAGRYVQKLTDDVTAPRLTVTAPNLTVVYGDPLPELYAEIEGFVGDEGASFCYDGCCRTTADPDAGVYRITPTESEFEGYQTEYVEGTLTVLPRTLEVEQKLIKRYDGSNVIENPELHVVGVLQGDDVSVQCDRIYLENKNVGEKLALLGTATLAGKDAHNYALPDFAEALIVPKALALVGTTVKSKLYDGTTKATIDKPGTLEGVCDGDSVAIGNIEPRFDGAEAGNHTVRLDDVSLVGADKDNYVLVRVEKCEAEIQDKARFWDKLLNLPDASDALCK